MLCHGVVLDPCVSLSFASVAEGRVSVSASCSISSTASLFRVLQYHNVVPPVDSCVDTHAPLRGPLVLPALLAVFESRVYSCLSLARGRPHDCEFCDIASCFAAVFLLGEASFERFTPAAASSSSLTWFCASWSAGTPRLRHVRKDRPVFMYSGAFLLGPKSAGA